MLRKVFFYSLGFNKKWEIKKERGSQPSDSLVNLFIMGEIISEY